MEKDLKLWKLNAKSVKPNLWFGFQLMILVLNLKKELKLISIRIIQFVNHTMI